MRPTLQKIETVFHAALELAASERAAFLETACAGDPELLREVESLLRHNSGHTTAFRAAIEPVASNLLTTVVEADLVPGAMLGPYRLDRKLGEGGMGSVYLATDSRLNRRVAVKVISRGLARTEEARSRFLREARSAAALSHANIATLHDIGETGEIPWLVMEYVEGVSLRSRLTGPLSQSTWLRYAGEIAAALEHAHSRRIIHRDIKPENILITEDERLKVIDFGLARAVHVQPTSSSTITETNAFVGTLAYAAPELLTGGTASARSDVYSLGLVLYEMACGEQPFSRLTGHAQISAILSGSYPACETRASAIPPQFAALIDRCMSREPAARYKDGAELASALRHLQDAGAAPQLDTAAPTLAVIDFMNIGGAPDLDWLGTGIAETLSADLAKTQIRARRQPQSRGPEPAAARQPARRRRNRASRSAATWARAGSSAAATSESATVSASPRADRHGTGDTIAAEKIDGRWTDLFDVQDRVVECGPEGAHDRVRHHGPAENPARPRPATSPPTSTTSVRRRQMYEMQGKSLYGRHP